MEERLRAQRLRGAQNDVLCGARPPPLNVILRGLIANQCNGPRIPSSDTECNHGFRPTLYLPPYFPFLTVTQLRIFSPHGGGRFTQTSLSCHHRRPMSGLYLPCQTIFFPKCLANENIHCDVDENQWPNPQDKVDENIEVQWGTLLFY